MHAVAAAVMLITGLAQHQDANALALGRVAVKSALGEPLRAEIAVPQISADEAASLKVKLGNPADFGAKGMEYNPALGTAEVKLQRSASGASYLSVTSSRTVTEPFMDLIIEATWASGKIVRDYTLLFDPPRTKKAAPEPVAAAADTPKTKPAAAPSPATAAPSAPKASAPAAAPAASAAEAEGGQVTVKRGDTAGAIARSALPANVSLDQMLVAMLRANPNAFIDNNVNRLKAGAILDMPTAEEAQGLSRGEARRMIVSQARDFNAYRERLAGAIPDAGVGEAAREATGKVETQVEENKPEATAPDRLELSKGQAAAGGDARADRIAKQIKEDEAAARAEELKKNIEELKDLQPVAENTKTPAAPAAPEGSPAVTGSETPSAEGPGVTGTSPAAEGEETPAGAPAAEEGTPAAETAPTEPAAAPEPAPAPPPPPPAPAPAPAPLPAPPAVETSFMDQITGSPWLLPVGALVLAALGGLAFFRLRKGNKDAPVDSSFLESRLQPDSFFGASGGQRIDTQDAQASGSSMVYSPSQLDAAGDVDPVAEADVYLAYGRDLQAEEILKEAMRSAPTRVAIHTKLLEIYAKRRDAKAFEVLATETYGLTQGQGPDWEQVCEMGRELDANNQLYQPGGAPEIKAPVSDSGTGGLVNTMPFTSSTQQDTEADKDSAPGLDLDLDLDVTTGEPSASMPLTPEPEFKASMTSGMADLDLTEQLTSDAAASAPAPVEAPAAQAQDAAASAPADMDFDLDFPSKPGELLDAGEEAQAKASDSSMMSLDLDGVSLDLSGAQAEAAAPAVDEGDTLTQENPLETKLSLAEEFRAIGDMEGARSLAEEVVAEADGALKSKATAFLADLS
ncbi:FimV/HubP family polar landmark protein [Hydrogenophaga sp. 5NK40-0174]|uniref:FimV/HubP family polar landmark protein n=1 Tax=Hydrogenophaga sp. 5NK40-0174 TaxID=3127649 RepID=UPI00310AE2B6